MNWEGDAVPREYNSRKDQVVARDGDACVITGLKPPEITADFAYIIPFALSKYINRLGSLFYRGLKCLIGEWRGVHGTARTRTWKGARRVLKPTGTALNLVIQATLAICIIGLEVGGG
jgi:hypothetical protein